MASVYQEIHCTTSGQGCGGYILVKINVDLNRRITLVCPKCQHKHRRNVRNGQIIEEGRHAGGSEEELYPTLAAWSETPRTKCMQQVIEKKQYDKERDGVVIKKSDDFISPPADIAQAIVRESFVDRFLGKFIG